MLPETRYAKSGDLSIAYQVAGTGPHDIVLVLGFVSHIEVGWETPPFSAIFGRLASFGRLIVFDKRGMGLSDRTAALPTLEERMDDVRAVMDAAGSERATLVGISEGGPMSLLFAATYPERTSALVLWASFARVLTAPDFPVGVEREVSERSYRLIEKHWGTGQAIRRIICQDAPTDGSLDGFFARYERNSSTPAGAVATMRFGVETDVRHVLPAISVPSLIVHRIGDPLVPVRQAHYLASQIPGALLREFPGTFHLSVTGADAEVFDSIEEFITGERAGHVVHRILKTVLFTDIVGSTERAVQLGDRSWRSLLDQHDAMVHREVERARGRVVNTTGDGIFAAFDGPARAIRCAQSILANARSLGLDVRAGLHTGECEVRGDDLAGIAVHIGARVAALAEPGEILATSTVRDLVAGSGIVFDDRGVRALKGVPGEWRLLAATR